MLEQTWDWTTEDLGLGTAMLQDIWTCDCSTSGLDIALCASQPGGPKGPADIYIYIYLYLYLYMDPWNPMNPYESLLIPISPY